jgi:hypothetical protein
MRYYETRSYEHEQDLNAKNRAQRSEKAYKQKYLSLRSKMREFVKSHNIEITEEIVKILGIKTTPIKENSVEKKYI